MKIGLVSDTHGNLKLLREVLAGFKREKVSLVIHLGDNFDDANLVQEYKLDLIRVPGVYSPQYLDPEPPNRIIEDLGGLRALLTHTLSSHEHDSPQDLMPEEVVSSGQADAVFYGHTHIPKAEVKDGILWVNPGHLRPSDKRGYPPSYAIAEIDGAKTRITIYNALDRSVIQQIDWSK